MGEDSSNFQAVGGKFGLVTSNHQWGGKPRQLTRSFPHFPPYKSIIFRQWEGRIIQFLGSGGGGKFETSGGGEKFGIPGCDVYFRTSGGGKAWTTDQVISHFPTYKSCSDSRMLDKGGYT